MAKQIIPSSFKCDCNHESNFSENTIREMERLSRKKKVSLGDGGVPSHSIIFHKEKAIEIICPTLGKCKIIGFI